MILVQLTVIRGCFWYYLLLLVDVFFFNVFGSTYCYWSMFFVQLTVIVGSFWYNLLLFVEVESAGDEALDPTSQRLSLSD